MLKSSTFVSSRGAASVCVMMPCRPVVTPFRSAVAHPESARIVQTLASSAQATGAPEKPKLSSRPDDDAETLRLSPGYHWYETMLILNSTLSDEERDKELAKFEAYLNKEDCQHINALVRPRTRMAYPIKSEWEGIYVLYSYACKRQTAKQIQLLLSKPEAGSEGTLLRHITLCK